MTYLEAYLDTIINRENNDLAESIKKTVQAVAPKHFEEFSFYTHEIGLLFGNVQSGKTGQMFGLLCGAADAGFSVFLILTTDNIVLQHQTLARVQADLPNFCICDEYDSEKFADNKLMKPAIIVLKKNFRTLKQWANILGSTGFMIGNPLFVIDDEADAASLNTLINACRQSSINRYLDMIKNQSSSSIYLQVTGTPQALLLQAKESGWRPYFTHYFRPGATYFGGEFFFPQEKPVCISFIEEMENPLYEAVLHHLVATAQILLAGGKVCNFLIHPSVRKKEHTKYKNDVCKVLQKCRDNIASNEFKTHLEKVFCQVQPSRMISQKFKDVYEFIQNLLQNDKIKIIVMNGNAKVSSEEYETGSNIVIGGNTLGRGVTFSRLQTIYYTRTAKKPQADTMWQHSRMFGYDRDGGMMMVYIDKNLYKLFSDINATNNSIISQIEKGIDNIKIYYPEGLNPTRKNVLDNKRVFVLSGGTNYYPLSPDNETIDDIDKLLKAFDENVEQYQVSLRLVKEILTHITTDGDFKLSSFMAFIDMLLAENPACQACLIVRRNRDIRKGSGALLSPIDWNLGGDIQDKVVLTMYQMTGSKGWEGRKVWVPNIKLPENVSYYDVVDNDDE